MFKKIASKSFGVVSVLATFIVIFAACGSGSGGGGGDDPSSSGGYVPTHSSAFVGEAIDQGSIVLNVEVRDNFDRLNIYASVDINPASGKVFDYVEVKVDGVKINDDGDGNGFESFTFDKTATNGYDISNKKYCDDNTHYVCLSAYIDGQEELRDKCETFVRNKNICDPPSSSSMPSSSSATLRYFSPQFEGELNVQTGEVGFLLESGTVTTNWATADIYYDCPSSCDPAGPIKTMKNTVKIIYQFRITYPNGNWYDIPVYFGNTPDNPQYVSNPVNTSDFPLSYGSGSNEAPYGEQYYMIRTGASPDEWTTTDYLLLIKGVVQGSNNRTLRIQTWKVN